MEPMNQQRKPYTVVCCGSRTWSDFDTIYDRLSQLKPGTVILCTQYDTGANAMVKQAVEELQGLRFVLKEIIPDWRRNAILAGPLANAALLDQKPDLVIAFHNHLETESKAAKNMVTRAKKLSIPVEVVYGRERRENEYQGID